MAPITELQERFGLFASGESSRRNFEDWFFDSWWDAESAADERTLKVFRRVEGLIAEASHAGWLDEGLREELAKVVGPFVVNRRRTGSGQHPLSISQPQESFLDVSFSQKMPVRRAVVPVLASLEGEPLVCCA